MVLEKALENIRKNGIDLILSDNKNYVKVFKKGNLIGSIYNTKNQVYFCGKEYGEISGRDLIEYFNTHPIANK